MSALEHLDPEPPAGNFEAFFNIEKKIGEHGIATTSVQKSPFMYLVEIAWGLETTYYLLQDHPEEVKAILDMLYEGQRRQVELIAESPARVVIQYEDTSSTILSPDIFRRYCLPYLNANADILREAGKIFLVHMCGTLKALAGDIAGGRFSGISDTTPHPTGDLPLDEAASLMPDKIITGGIDSTTYVSRDKDEFKQTITGLIQRIKPLKKVIMGSADTAPRDAPVENFRLIRKLVDEFGTYN